MPQPTVPIHTYGPTCHFAKPITSASKNDDDIPEMHAQFFYYAQYHIDDPLSAAPTFAASDAKSAKPPPRPFTPLDNNCLEAAWLKFGSEKDRKNHNRGRSHKANRPSHGNRLGSIIGTLASKVEQKKGSSEECGTPDSKSPGNLPSKPSSPRSKVSHFSAHAFSEHPSSHIGCSHHVGHGTYKSKPGQGEYQYASASSKSPHGSKALSSTKKFTKSKEKPKYPVVDNNTAINPPLDSQKLSADHQCLAIIDKRENPYNSNRADPQHAPLDFECCSDYDGSNSPPSFAKPKSHNEEDAQPLHTNCELGECQGDGANELVNKVSRSFKERKSAQPPTIAPSCDLSREEHTELEEHEHSKDHQCLAKHVQTRQLDAVVHEPAAIRKQKALEKGPSFIKSPDIINRPDAANDAGTTGLPFLKFPSRPVTPQATSSYMPLPAEEVIPDPCIGHSETDRRRDERDSTETETVLDHQCKAHKNTKDTVDVPVGASRLHKVCLPALQMEPIYWSPVNDIAGVTRGTWFYNDTMLPVEPPVANQLEIGYREMRPWSQTWNDEMRSAMEVGAAGEEKVAHRLWPKDGDKSILSKDMLSTDPYCAARCFQGEAAAEGFVDLEDSNKKSPDTKIIVKKYPNCQVIYKDSHNAYILKPNLQPSAYHKRRPVNKINKGFTVGIHVCRGFNQKTWEKVHPSKKKEVVIKVEEHAAVSGDSGLSKIDSCPGCLLQEQPKECTDLCLVIHGIGQKLSERMESFHFTHAINGFRRSINAELANEAVQKVCRKELGGVMVLPVNWRSNLSFEDDPSKDGEVHHKGSSFSLKDITQPTLSAVRTIINDVMLDVPYYMSGNKDKMVQAVVAEANRVYRLWCKNNPYFYKNGRVHVIAHSLGSVMAMEILSKQPTLISKVNPDGKKSSPKHFDFNTSNLFMVGSPSGFFMLLEKGTLVPRKGQNKPGAEIGDDVNKGIVGEQGTFGCLAVDNIYNIMHTNDPIAYRLNPCIDAQYAASLKEARVPSATTGFFESIGNAMKTLTPGSAAPTDLGIGQIPKPTLTARMPSQLEMETHDFTAEENAEKRFCLLNDNGQTDYCLASGGGPLEIQYLNMLSAHSSYWTSPDFIRMLCTEVGRKPGQTSCLPNMKAVKIRNKP